jgi:Skp family chaperone for outer membrane proteins
MRKILVVAAMAALFIGAAAVAPSYAQGKIGTIDSQQVLEKSTEGKKVIARLQEADKKNQNAVAALDDQIRTIQTKLNTQRLTLTEEAALQLQADLERKNTDRKRLTEDAMSTMQELTTRLFARIQQELMPIVEGVGKEKGYDIIFDLQKSGAVYRNPAIEITEEVIKRYDASKAVQK